MPQASFVSTLQRTLSSAPTVGEIFVLQIGDKSDSVSVDRLKPVISTVPVVPAVPPLWGRPCLVPASVHKPPGSWLSSGEESEVFSGSSYAAPPESSPDCSRFSVSLRSPPTSPSGGSILWLLQRRHSSSSGLQTQRELSGNVLSWMALSG